MRKLKKVKINSMATIIFCLVAMIVISVCGWIYYNYLMKEIGLEDVRNVKNYDKHYVLITDNVNSSFWESVYESGAREAEKDNVLLELMGMDSTSEYGIVDLMEMSIAETVDGILLEYTGGENQELLIDKAVEKGIPVITLSEDAPMSKRQSYVGVNTYQLGEAYSEQVLSLIKPNTERVMILTHNTVEESTQKLVSVQISNAVTNSSKTEKPIKVEVENVRAQTAFDSEEAIRKIFLTTQGPPDILVCFEEVDTECAYQAVIDYNQVGTVSIVGYYATPTTLEGIEKGIIPVTVELDASQMGKMGVQALTEYIEEGRVSDYYSVGVNIINGENIEEYYKKNEKES